MDVERVHQLLFDGCDISDEEPSSISLSGPSNPSEVPEENWDTNAEEYGYGKRTQTAMMVRIRLQGSMGKDG